MLENLTAGDFATAVDAVIITSTDEVEEIENDDEELVAPSTRDLENLFEILKNLSLFSEKRGNQMQDLIDKLKLYY